MQKPKILVLVMSCNNDFFNSATEVISNTWLKNCDKYSIDYYTYSGGFGKTSVNNHSVECKSQDDLDNTFVKTVECLKLVKAANYDYVVRTNTSTFINIDMLNEYLTRKFNSDNKDKVCCGDIAILKNMIQLRGNAIVFPKWFTEKIVKFNISELPSDIENTHDDVVISYIFQKQFDKPILQTLKNDVDFIPCIYLNDEVRRGHPLAVFDTEYHLGEILSKSVFIAYRKNSGDRYLEFGECYKLHNIGKHITNDYMTFTFYDAMKLVWIYDSEQFVKL